MRGNNDDAAHAREDSFLGGLIPQVTEHLAERLAEDFDAEAGQARFGTWLAAHTGEPATPAKARAGAGYARPAGTGRIKRSRSWLSGARGAVPVPDGRFLIWLSGAQREILEECPADRPKYTGIGASILISAALVGVSLAFALVTALNVALWVALPVAFASGAAALSLNRLFVVSLPRKGGARAQLFRAIPRFLLALLVGLVISTPFVLQIFQPEIQHQITIQHDKAVTAYYEQLNTDPLAKQITADRAKYNADIAALAQARSAEQAAALKQEVAAAERELAADQSAFQSAFRQRTDALTAANQGNTGLLARLQALDTITAGNSVLAAARWLLFALFVVLECLPVMIKVMLNLGPASTYDRVLEAEESAQLRIAEVRAQLRIAELESAMGLAGQKRAAEARLAQLQIERERLRRWEADQMRPSSIASDDDDDDDDSPKGSPARRYALRLSRRAAGLAIGAAGVLALRSGTPFDIATAVVVGVLLVSTLAMVGAALLSDDRTDRAVRLLRVLRSENPSITGSGGRYQRGRLQRPAKAKRSTPASTATSESSWSTEPSSPASGDPARSPQAER